MKVTYVIYRTIMLCCPHKVATPCMAPWHSTIYTCINVSCYALTLTSIGLVYYIILASWDVCSGLHYIYLTQKWTHQCMGESVTNKGCGDWVFPVFLSRSLEHYQWHCYNTSLCQTSFGLSLDVHVLYWYHTKYYVFLPDFNSASHHCCFAEYANKWTKHAKKSMPGH